ncbi:hypothetical protein GCM10027093_74710 [Paraburkholderia jirisanensis]
MCEQVVAALVRGNEAKTLAVVEPLDGTGIHENFLKTIEYLRFDAGARKSIKEGEDNEYRGGRAMMSNRTS